MGDTRLEEAHKTSGKTSPHSKLYAPDYALTPNSQVVDQDLADLISSWRWLPDTTKAEVSALVRAAMAEEGAR